jgi:hypothetical protein
MPGFISLPEKKKKKDLKFNFVSVYYCKGSNHKKTGEG